MEVAEQVVGENNHLAAAPGPRAACQGFSPNSLCPDPAGVSAHAAGWDGTEQLGLREPWWLTSSPRSGAKLGSAHRQETGLFLIAKKKELNLFPIFPQAVL